MNDIELPTKKECAAYIIGCVIAWIGVWLALRTPAIYNAPLSDPRVVGGAILFIVGTGIVIVTSEREFKRTNGY